MEKGKILILGDICPAWGYRSAFDKDEKQSIFGDILTRLSEANLVVANLESPATDCEQKLNKNSVCLCAKPQDIAILKDCGIDGVSLANNHILDYTTKGLDDTIDCLRKNEMFFYGAGDQKDAAAPCFVDLCGKRIGFLAFAEQEFNCAIDYQKGANLWNDLTGPQQIREAKEKCDYLIVQYHGGIEHYRYPSPYLQAKCRAMVSAGANFVTCQHSHCIGTKETWENGEILYGQGNTIFGYREGKDSWNRGFIIQLTVDEDINVKYIPIVATPEGERLAEKELADQILESFEKESEKINDSNFIKESWKEFCRKQKDEYFPMAFAKGRIFLKLNRMLHGRLIKVFTKKTSRRNAMNLIRCDAHKEVLQTIMEEDFYN